MFDKFGGEILFSKMGLRTEFHLIRVKPEDIVKPVFNAKYSQFEYLVMPMDFFNVPATFQSLMKRIFYDFIDVFMFVHIYRSSIVNI